MNSAATVVFFLGMESREILWKHS